MDKTININIAGTLFRLMTRHSGYFAIISRQLIPASAKCRADMKQLRISKRVLLKYFSRRKGWQEL